MRLKSRNPIAPALISLDDDLEQLGENFKVVSALYSQLNNCALAPRGERAPEAWGLFDEILKGIRSGKSGEDLKRMAKTRFNQ